MRTALLSLIAGLMTAWPQTGDSAFVRVAGLGGCSLAERDIILRIRPQGLLLNQETQTLETVGRRLDEICATRRSKYVYIMSDPNVRFDDALRVIRIAAAHVDHVVIVTPSVRDQATYQGDGTCLVPNLPPGYPPPIHFR